MFARVTVSVACPETFVDTVAPAGSGRTAAQRRECDIGVGQGRGRLVETVTIKELAKVLLTVVLWPSRSPTDVCGTRVPSVLVKLKLAGRDAGNRGRDRETSRDAVRA